MINMKLLLLLLPAVALASIEVKFVGKLNIQEQTFQGRIPLKPLEERSLTDSDREAFGIRDEDLKTAVEKYNGKKPDQIFLTPDTPWGNLYQKLAKKPIAVKIEVSTPINLNELKKQKVELSHSIYENEHSEKKKIYVLESGMTYDTLASIWFNPQKISASPVNVEMILTVDKDSTYIRHAFTFGPKRKTTAKKSRSQSAPIDLAPGQKVLAQLEVQKCSLIFQIPYKISLSGDIIVNYNEEYKNDHFHSFDINSLTGNKTLTVYQTLSYDFYYEQKLKIIDAKDGYTILKSVAPEGEATSSNKRRSSAAKHAAETGTKMTKKAPLIPIDFTFEDLNNIVQEALENQLDEESNESTENRSAEQTENKTPGEVPKPE